jgi:raffinose/stachyose/melibiose transport system substrate-binding protein
MMRHLPQTTTTGPSFSRRTLLKGAGASALALTLPGLTGCSASNDPTLLRFFQSKRETVDYFTARAVEFNSAHPSYLVELEASTNLTADFVRDKPVAIGLGNFALDIAGFAVRGVLSDLSDRPELATLQPAMIALGQQFGSRDGEVNVIPYSVAGAGVIYNRDVFDAAGVDVPTTWTQFIAACETFKSKGITPIQATITEAWSIKQGIFEFVSGGMIPDIPGFFDQMHAQGTDIGPDSPVSFQKVFADPCRRMLELVPYFNANARNDNYSQGNSAFAAGAAAMMFQGPWAFSQITGINPDINAGMFPLPATDNPDDTKVAVNLDLVAYIPNSQSDVSREGAHEFLGFLLNPDVCNAYNRDNLAFAPFIDAPPQTNPKIAGLQEYVAAGRIYQGAWRYIPTAIPIEPLCQKFILDGDVDGFLLQLDADWKRLAIRLSA